jgi:hypothetical protein
MLENWKDIEGFEGIYQVSSLGNIRNYKKQILTPVKTDDGYLRVHLRKTGVSKNLRVHRIVANHFIENPENKPEVNHINGNKTDNRVENLEWVTKSENAIHAYKHGLQNSLKNFQEKTIPLADIRKIKHSYKVLGLSIRNLAFKFGYTRRTIKSIINAG